MDPDKVLEKFGPVVVKLDRASQDVRNLSRERDELILKASKAGATRRAVAAAARLTPGRVQQIIDGQQQSPALNSPHVVPPAHRSRERARRTS